MLVFVPENQVQNYLIILYVPLLLLLNNLLFVLENQVQNYLIISYIPFLTFTKKFTICARNSNTKLSHYFICVSYYLS